jgi:D-alanyl-D-alanine carboxypeptidase
MPMLNNHKLQLKKGYLFIVYAFVICIVFVCAYFVYVQQKQCAENRAIKSTIQRDTQNMLSQNLEAKAFYVYDFTQKKVVVEKNSATALPLASLSKILVARMALAKLDLNKTYTIQQADLDKYGDTGFILGETYTIDNLLTAALVPSSNDGTASLMHALGYNRGEFAQVATERAHDLGFISFSFQNSTGLDLSNDSPSNIGSAKDTTHLLYTTWEKFPSVIGRSSQIHASITSTGGHVTEYKNTDILIPEIPLLIASKTGYTLSAGGNLSVLWRTPEGHILGATLLGSSINGRFSDMRQITTDASILVRSDTNSTALVCKN